MGLPRVHIKTLSGCEGCQDCLEHSEQFVPLLGAINLVECRLLTSPVDLNVLPGDIVIFEGAPNTNHHIKELEEIRAISGVLIIAMGTCAVFGGVQANVTDKDLEEVHDGKWGEYNQTLELKAGAPISHYVKVDAEIPGCPIDPEELAFIIAKLLSGGKPRKFNHAVCAECHRVGCLLNDKELCLAMITVAGCKGVCPNVSRGCLGCRGFLPKADVEQFVAMLVEKGFSEKDVRRKLDFYNAFKMKNGGDNV
jgi:sulfhydrogenase subunit delta